MDTLPGEPYYATTTAGSFLASLQKNASDAWEVRVGSLKESRVVATIPDMEEAFTFVVEQLAGTMPVK